MKAPLAALAAAALLVASTPRASAGGPPDPRRKVAVLAYRAGSSALAGVDDRLAKLLARSTSLQVIDGDAARRSYGANLDRDLVACEGKADCVARIGAKLDAVEVLLVGISEFGDVILTLQRVDVRRARVLNRIAEAMEPGLAPDPGAIDRYLKRLMPTTDFVRWGIIHIDSNVDGADVSVDKMPRGKTPLPPLKLRAPASYEVQVVKSGYLPFSAVIKVPPDGETRVQTHLTRREPVAWYKRWWVAAIAGTVVIGAATVTVMAVQGSPDSVPVVIPGFGN